MPMSRITTPIPMPLSNGNRELTWPLGSFVSRGRVDGGGGPPWIPVRVVGGAGGGGAGAGAAGAGITPDRATSGREVAGGIPGRTARGAGLVVGEGASVALGGVAVDGEVAGGVTGAVAGVETGVVAEGAGPVLTGAGAL